MDYYGTRIDQGIKIFIENISKLLEKTYKFFNEKVLLESWKLFLSNFTLHYTDNSVFI
jgi:hypothetical protein